MQRGTCCRLSCAELLRAIDVVLTEIQLSSRSSAFWRRWLPFSITTVLVGADFIVMTSRVRGGLVDHAHQASDIT
jgi:hypothetical protein